MPAKSGKQFRLMLAVLHGSPHNKGIGGISKSTAREFIKKTPKRKRSMFSKGK